MSLTSTNVSSNVTTPGNVDITFSHTHPVGSDWMVALVYSPVVPVVGAEYNNSSLTLVDSTLISNYGYWYIFAEDMSANTGTNTFKVDYDTVNYNPVITSVYSFSDASGVANGGFQTLGSGNTNIKTLNVAANSRIIAAGWAGNNVDANVEIPQGTVLSLDFNQFASNYGWGTVSANLSSGSITFEINSNASPQLASVEVQEVSAPPTTRRIWSCT